MKRIKEGSLVRIRDHIAEARGGSFPDEYHGRLAYVIRTPTDDTKDYKLRVIVNDSGHMPIVFYPLDDLVPLT